MGPKDLVKAVADKLRPEDQIHGLCRERGYATIHDMHFVAANAFILFLVAVGISQALMTLIPLVSPIFRGLDEYHKRNAVTNIIEVGGLTIVLFFQVYYGWDLLFNNDDLDSDARAGLGWAALVMCSMYTFELIYRLKVHWQLYVHHLVSILVILLCFFEWHDYPADYKPVVRLCVLFLCHGSTEHLCFIALVAHRMLSHERHASVLRWLHFWAAITSYTIKTSVFLITWVLWMPLALPETANGYTWFWRFVFPVLNVLLIVTQWWTSNVFYVLSRRFLISLTKDQAQYLEGLNIRQTACYYTADVALARRRNSKIMNEAWENNSEHAPLGMVPNKSQSNLGKLHSTL